MAPLKSARKIAHATMFIQKCFGNCYGLIDTLQLKVSPFVTPCKNIYEVNVIFSDANLMLQWAKGTQEVNLGKYFRDIHQI